MIKMHYVTFFIDKSQNKSNLNVLNVTMTVKANAFIALYRHIDISVPNKIFPRHSSGNKSKRFGTEEA